MGFWGFGVLGKCGACIYDKLINCETINQTFHLSA